MSNEHQEITRLQKENDDLRGEVTRLHIWLDRVNLALESTLNQLDRFLKTADISGGWIVAIVRDSESHPILIESGGMVFGIETDHELETSKRYIFCYFLEGRFHRACKTHHIILQVSDVIPLSPDKQATLPPQMALILSLITMFVNTFAGGKPS